MLRAECVPALDDDEHVVNTDPEHEEGDDGVGRGVPEPDGGADAVADNDAHDDTEYAAETEEESLLDKVEPTDHDDDVDEDDQVADKKHPGVLEGLGLQGLEEHFCHESVGCHVLWLMGSVRYNLKLPILANQKTLIQQPIRSHSSPQSSPTQTPR